METSYRLFWFLATCAAALILARPAGADVDPFEFQVYGYGTMNPGDFEPQLLNSYVAIGHHQGDIGTSPTFPSQGMIRTALELEYGFTDKITGAYYLNLARPDGGSLQYAGSKFRLRGRFAERDELPVDIGWYAEVEWWQPQFDDDSVELEVMTIFQKDIGNWSFIANAPDIDKVIVGADRREVFELSYRGEVLYRMSKNFIPGIQVYGGIGQVNNVTPFNQQQQYIFPVVHTVLPGNFAVGSFGIGVGLTPGSDPLLIKANIYFNSDGTWEGKIR